MVELVICETDLMNFSSSFCTAKEMVSLFDQKLKYVAVSAYDEL